MVAVLAVIQQQRRRFTDVQHHNIEATIIADVAERGTAPRGQGHSGKTSRSRDFLKGSITSVAEQQHRLAIVSFPGEGVDLGINVSVGHENVQPTGIVHIEKSRSPADIRIGGFRDVGSSGDVDEPLPPKIAIQRIRLVDKIGDHHVETAIMIVVAPIDTHGSLLHAVDTYGDPLYQTFFLKCSITPVVVEKVWPG